MKSEQQLINSGWSSHYVNVHVHVDALWKAASMKARRQSKVANGSDLVFDGDGSLSRSMMIKTYNTLMMERICFDRVASEIVFQPCIQTPHSVARCAWFAAREEPNLHPRPADKKIEFGHVGHFLTY